MIIFYHGDVDIRHGGYYYTFDSERPDTVSVTRVWPFSDVGGPDNVFQVERLTVTLLEGDALARVLAHAGLTEETLPTGELRHRVLVDVHVFYGPYEIDWAEVVQIGPDDPYCAPVAIQDGQQSVRLRAGSSLRRYVLKQHTNS